MESMLVLPALDTSLFSLPALDMLTFSLPALDALNSLLPALDTSISLLPALDMSISSLPALDTLIFPLVFFFSFTLVSVMTLHRVSSESEPLPPESVWIFLEVSLFFGQSLEAAKCPVFLQVLHDLPLAKQLSPPVHL